MFLNGDYMDNVMCIGEHVRYFGTHMKYIIFDAVYKLLKNFFVLLLLSLKLQLKLQRNMSSTNS